MTKILAITGNAGQGKSTLAANLAFTFSSVMRDVVLMDADQRTPTIGFHYGMPLIQRTVQDALEGIPVDDCLYEHPGGLSLLLSGLQGAHNKHAKELLPKLEKHADVVVIDVPTRDMRFYQANIPTIVVTKADFPSIMHTKNLLRLIPNVLGVVLNRAHHDAYELSAGNVQELLGVPVMGMVHEENNMREALKLGHPLVESHPECETAGVLKLLAANLMKYYFFEESHARA